MRSLFSRMLKMQEGNFYFVVDDFFEIFKDEKLMGNKESDRAEHNRPCFCAFRDRVTGLFWLIPVSSQVDKFHRIYQHKVDRNGRCDTIVFGQLLGQDRAFLIQNMFPISSCYIKNEYLDAYTQTPVRVDGVLQSEIKAKAAKVLRLVRKGHSLIFPNVLHMEAVLLHSEYIV